MSPHPSAYTDFDVPMPDRRRRPVLATVILAASVLAAATILFGAVASSAPSSAPPVTGPGPTTQLGVALLPNDPATVRQPNG